MTSLYGMRAWIQWFTPEIEEQALMGLYERAAQVEADAKTSIGKDTYTSWKPAEIDRKIKTKSASIPENRVYYDKTSSNPTVETCKLTGTLFGIMAVACVYVREYHEAAFFGSIMLGSIVIGRTSSHNRRLE